MKWGGTHRFHDAAAVEAKHRVSLKSNGEKIRVRTDTQTEKDLLRVTQEELVFETLDELLRENEKLEDPPVSGVVGEIADSDPTPKINLTVPLHSGNGKHVSGDEREHLVHREVLLSWEELLTMFAHCFPAVKHKCIQEQ